MLQLRVIENKKKLTCVIFLVLSILSFKTNVVARECCPPNVYLGKASKMCSDNKTFDLNCPSGFYFLEHILSDEEKLLVKPNESFAIFEGNIPEDKFCTGEIQGVDHLVALICFDGERSSELEIVLRILMLISTLFLLATFYVYMRLPNLKDLQGKCVLAFLGCLISSYIILMVVQTFPSSNLECGIQAATLYFFISSTFFWNNIISFNIWRAIRKVSFDIEQKWLFVIYLLWGFGAPAFMVAVSFILEHVPSGNHIRPRFGETRCWFNGKTESWSYFYGPISVLLVLNTIMFFHSVWILWRNYKTSNNKSLRSLRFKCFLYLKLFLLMGVSWTFEVISFAAGSEGNLKYLWFVMDFLNSAQGILIFLILVVFRQKVRLGILKNKLLNINWPRSWAREEIQESSIASLAEEFELPDQKSKMIAESQK